jgi:hypothetical protein
MLRIAVTNDVFLCKPILVIIDLSFRNNYFQRNFKQKKRALNEGQLAIQLGFSVSNCVRFAKGQARPLMEGVAC